MDTTPHFLLQTNGLRFLTRYYPFLEFDSSRVLKIYTNNKRVSHQLT